MRSPEELKERIRMALVEDINSKAIDLLLAEPENQFPQFLEKLTNHLYEVCADEIIYRKRY